MRFQDHSGISWTICKQSAPRPRQITTPTPRHLIFYRSHALPGAQPTVFEALKDNNKVNSNGTVARYVPVRSRSVLGGTVKARFLSSAHLR